MKIKNNLVKLIIIILSIHLLNGCSPKKNIVKKTYNPDNTNLNDNCNPKYYSGVLGGEKGISDFLKKCNDESNYLYIRAKDSLKRIELQKQKDSNPDPKVVLPKLSASPPKVISQSEKPQTIIIPTGSLGEMSKVRIKILEKTLESKLDDYFAIVPKELFEEAQEQAFQEMDSDECTEDQCILMIKEILQIENAFKMDLLSEDGDTQISITWNDQDQKRVEEDYCEGCKTKELRLMIGGLVEKLVKGNN
jgi:hypothetical protein